MRRIGLVVVLAAYTVFAQSTVEAQQGSRVYRVGFLTPASGPNPLDEVFQKSLGELGYAEGRNLVLERRYTGGRLDQFAPAAADLVRLNVDLIVAVSPAATSAAKNATTTIPVVFLAGGAAVEQGLVAGLARPGWTHSSPGAASLRMERIPTSRDSFASSRRSLTAASARRFSTGSSSSFTRRSCTRR